MRNILPLSAFTGTFPSFFILAVWQTMLLSGFFLQKPVYPPLEGLTSSLKNDTLNIKVGLSAADILTQPRDRHNLLDPHLVFIRQDNSPIPLRGDEACHMISQFIPGVSLEDSTSFEGLDNLDPFNLDENTFRIEVTGIAAGQEVEFKLDILRNGVLKSTTTYQSVEGLISDTTTNTTVAAYRTNEHIRLVSNKRPVEIDSARTEFQYDDEYLGHQTVLVMLGDTVQASVIVNGEKQGSPIALPVGMPSDSNSSYAVLTADLNFFIQEGLEATVQPDTTVKRMNEDWAQAAIQLERNTTSTFSLVDNILTIRTRGAVDTNGELMLTLQREGHSPSPISINFETGDTAADLAQSLADTIEATLKVPAEASIYYTSRCAPPNGCHRWIVMVDKGTGKDVIFSDMRTVPAVPQLSMGTPKLKKQDVIFDQLWRNIIGLNYKDADPTTIDIFVVADTLLPDDHEVDGKKVKVNGIASSNSYVSRKPGLQNTIVIVSEAADGNDEYLPFTASHEVGHVLFNGPFPGSIGGHHADPTNLMFQYARPSGEENYRGRRRLTQAQIYDARQDSGVDAGSSILKR